MSSRERKLLKKIKRYKKLNKILIKTKCKDCYELQRLIPSPVAEYVMFSNRKMDDSTFVYLTDKSMEVLEEKYNTFFWHLAPLVVSVISLIVSAISLMSKILERLPNTQA